MELLVLGAEVLFVVLFAATFIDWLQRRDPVSRDVMLVFSALAVLFLLELWQRVTGQDPPALVSRLAGALLILQPLFTLHLVSLIRRVPPWVFIGAAILSLGTGIPVVFLMTGLPVWAGLVAFFALIVNQILAATFLLLEARRRQGPGASRFAFAALATGLFAVALLVAVLGAGATQAGTAGPATRDASRAIAGVLALIAGIGYMVAFLPPRRIRAFWQADTAARHGITLLDSATEPVETIWRRFTDLASSVTGARSALLAPIHDDRAAILATSGFTVPAELSVVSCAELDVLCSRASSGTEERAGSSDDLADRLARASDARFVAIVPLPRQGGEPGPVLVLLSAYRSLFHSSDREVLASLGAQTALAAERRAIVAEQESMAERLAATNEVLRSASQAKSDFLASMSHELRTPLSAILGFSDLIRQEPAMGDNVLVPREWIEHIHTGGEHLLSLINDVLDLAKVEAGRLDLHLEPVELSTAVGELLNGVRPLAERKRLRLVGTIPAFTVSVDRGRLRQVLYNLLSNAIKYTPDEGSVRVEAVADGEWARITVSDTGVGIDPEDQALVFEEFRQVGDPAERQEGTGLGLALTRRLVEAHGGRIELESRRGEGSRFTVTLPLAHPSTPPRTPSQAPAAAGAAPETGRPLKEPVGSLLLIEDDPGAVRLIREYLEPLGYALRVATDGETGLAMAAAERPAAIILDIVLPGIDGWEVLRRLRTEPPVRDVPVVIVTVVDEVHVGLALGAVDYLVKPIQRETLIASLARHALTPEIRERPMRVLAVDDEASALALIRAALEPEGFEVVDANGGREALELMRTDSIDLVVCDLVMPDVDGFEVIASLKADPRTSPVPIVVCTAHDLSDADKARLNGKILGIVSKGAVAREGLRAWLAKAAPIATPAGGPA